MVTVRVKKEDKVGQTLWCNYFVIDKLLNQMFVVSLQSYLADMASKQQKNSAHGFTVTPSQPCGDVTVATSIFYIQSVL